MEKETKNNELTIQLRYCFNDEDLHSMNAEIFNECEKQFIKAIRSTEKYLENTLSIKIKPREEGSLIEVIQILTNNPAFNIILGATIGALFSRIPPQQSKSQKIDTLLKIKEAVKNETLTEEQAIEIIQNDKDLRKHKSNFFKSAKKEQEITKLESKTIIDTISKPLIIAVDRKDFDDFIIPETTEKIEDTQQVKIYIVAPILIEGRRDAWKGILKVDFKETPIDFKVIDKEFLAEVWNHSIEFKNGTFINCDLKTTQTTNIETEEIKVSRQVTLVINRGEDNGTIKNIIHKKKRKFDNEIQQLSLFDNAL